MIYLWIALLLLPQVVWGEEITSWSVHFWPTSTRDSICDHNPADDDPRDPSITCEDEAIISNWKNVVCASGWKYNSKTHDCDKLPGYCPVCGIEGNMEFGLITGDGSKLISTCPKCHVLFWD